MSRLSNIDLDDLSPEQKAVHANISDGPRGEVRGLYKALLHCPNLADAIQNLGSQLRFGARLPGPLRELAILVTARFWSSSYEWASHAAIAEKEGIEPAIITAISERRAPNFSSEDEEFIFSYCNEFHQTRKVSDEMYEQAVTKFDEEGVMELTALLGHYTLVAMVLSTFQILPSPDKKWKLDV